jgi:ketosteroid isomerase-like protein
MSRPRLPSYLHLFSACCLLLPIAAGAQGAAPGGPPHHDPKHARQQIAELEDQWKAATLAGDAGAMERLLSDDYVGISWTGQVNTKQMQLDRTRNRTLMVKTLDLTDVKIKVVGPVAIVTCRSEITGTNDGASIDGAFRYTRVYQRLPTGQWKITNFEATRIPNPNGDRHHPPHDLRPPPPPDLNSPR